ncbi:MATE family efflux transporter [Flavobacteriaceae bacterium]|nr:MATE family efflux transporter [Flavobacteriaceae bacterium]MDB4066780.1 MATE family efflux transporter [Flavobacteriaceae bacterium]MDB4152038.1 MATE family efflux transporter [Flavobacteriaceae bacterium]MDB9988579.1 MATE family efflux transporter [Flavobacteriaceae bacterium]
MAEKAVQMGTDPIGKLLLRQSLPASIGILVMSLNILIDTIFVGQWIGSNAIAAINVVLPVSFFIAALGMSIGMGGGSIISRALGSDQRAKANKTFGNQLTLTLLFTLSFMTLGLVFMEAIIPSFGGKGTLYAPAKIYYTIVLYGVPILGLAMMGNNTIRSEGKPKHAMYAMMLPSISNLLLDYLFINVFGWGMEGAAWATTLSYGVCMSYIFYFFISGKSDLFLKISDLALDFSIVKEIGSLGFVTLARQAVVSVTVLMVNNILFELSGESTVAVYAIISRMLMFALFPILGITQGFVPIAGFNFGADKKDRVLEVIRTALIYATVLATFVFFVIIFFSEAIASAFTQDQAVITKTKEVLMWVFLSTPIIGIQLIGSAYFQAIGKAIPALLLTLTRQGFFFIPLILILPRYYGEFGIWISFPIAEVIATIVTAYFLRKELKRYNK